jgi:DNA-binding MarR family transcriptional regulator
MTMFHDLKWSPSEKKIARKAYDTALEAALAKVMAEFKRRADAATTPSNMWDVEDYLRQQRREIEETFDYRYSQLPFVFARLIREGHLDESLLAGLSEEKREIIGSFLARATRA